MPRSRPASPVSDGIQIVERDWLICGLLWIVIGTLALSPLGVVAQAGRVLFVFMFCVHAIEAIYVTFRAWGAGLNAQKWLLRAIVLGSLALLAIETHLRKAPHPRSVR
jgi:hypothetical protein